VARYKCVVEYDGTNFEGWQSQPNGNSVQDSIEKSIKEIANKDIRITVAGRTDSGVHASGQVFHFDFDEVVEKEKLKLRINHILKDKMISIIRIEEVDVKFDSRKDANLRTYEYKIINRTSPLVLSKNKAWHVRAPLDVSLMQKAAKFFLGTHDFSTFRASSCEALSPIKTVEYSEVIKNDEQISYIIKSKSFLQHQVRSMVGALKLVGEKKWDLAQLKKALESKDRTQCAAPAPACGLYLINIEY
jgi:tRNA pseudouridine38-40 synthase